MVNRPAKHEIPDSPAAAEAFFASAQAVTGITPSRVTTDGHDAYPGAIKAKLGEGVIHRTSRYLNNHLEQDHRGIKGRSRPMHGFKSMASAHRFCCAYDEVRHFLRFPSPRGRRLSLDERRWFHLRWVHRLLTIMEQAAVRAPKPRSGARADRTATSRRRHHRM